MTPATAIPTAMTSREADALRALSRDRHVIEIGALFGYSTIALASSARRVISVDPHSGYPTPNSPSTWGIWNYNVGLHTADGIVRAERARYQDVWKRLPHAHGVFIDCSEEALELIEIAHRRGPDWIALHDVGHPVWHGATRAIEKQRLRTFVGQVDSLVVLM